jgi:hypothetical protein
MFMCLLFYNLSNGRRMGIIVCAPSIPDDVRGCRAAWVVLFSLMKKKRTIKAASAAPNASPAKICELAAPVQRSFFYTFAACLTVHRTKSKACGS